MVIVFLLAFAWCNNRKEIKYSPLLAMIILHLMLVFFLLITSFANGVIGVIAVVFDNLMAYAAEGVNFVFGNMANEGEDDPFFLATLLPIVVISAIIGILQYLKILPFIVKYIGLF